MRKILRVITANKLLSLILLLGLCLRIIGVYPGYPEHIDETPFSSAITMIYNHNLDPLEYGYPSLIPLIQMLVFKFVLMPIYWGMFYIKNLNQLVDGTMHYPFTEAEYYKYLHTYIVGPREVNVMYWGRYITAFFGTGVILLTYILGKSLFGRIAGLCAAFFVAVNFRQVLNSHIGLPDIYNAFFFLLAMIFSIKVLDKPTRQNYILAGVTNALYLCTKFQVFAFAPFFIAHTIVTWKKSNRQIKNFIKLYFSKYFLISIAVVPIIFVLINPYHLMNLDKALSIRGYQLLKYKTGIYELDIYGISYLYHVILGPALTWVILISVFVALLKWPIRAFLLILAVAQFMYVFVFYSRGGFYIRNFVSITPLLFVIAGGGIQYLFELSKNNIIKKGLFLTILPIFAFWAVSNNLNYSLSLITEYSRDWNHKTLISWLNKNIPPEAKVSSLHTIPLPVDDSQRFSYDTNHSFSIDEFNEEADSDYAIANFAWATNDFYWWMNRSTKESIMHYWQKPIDILEYSYTAIALRELEPHVIFSVVKPWTAPDTAFYVIKVPKYSAKDISLIKSYSFQENNDGWTKAGKFWAQNDNLVWEDATLKIMRRPSELPSIRWQSPVIDTEGWKGLMLEYQVTSKTEDVIPEETLKIFKTGYVFVSFYANLQDALNSKNRVGVRVSSRINTPNQLITKKLVSDIPATAKYITIGFGSYNTSLSSTELNWLSVYKANVSVDHGGIDPTPTHIDDDNLFPNSQANL